MQYIHPCALAVPAEAPPPIVQISLGGVDTDDRDGLKLSRLAGESDVALLGPSAYSRRLARGRTTSRRPAWWSLGAVAAGIAIGLVTIVTGSSPRPEVRVPETTSTSGSAAAVAATRHSLPPAGMHRVLDVTFKGSTLDTAIFSTCFPWEDSATGCANFGNPQAVSWYLPSQISVSGGALHLDAVDEQTPGLTKTGAPLSYPYRSGIVTTYSSFHFTYGYVQWVARLPAGPDLWPAFWLLPMSQQPLPEIDMIEGSPNPRISMLALHPQTGVTWSHWFKTADLASGWHTFGLDWKPGSLTWYVDGKALFTATANIPDVPMYLLATLAVTNYAPACLVTSPPASCTGSLTIRSVQVWQH